MWTTLSLLLSIGYVNCQLSTNEEEAVEFLTRYDEAQGEVLHKSVTGAWNYNTNITSYNLQVMVSGIITPISLAITFKSW